MTKREREIERAYNLSDNRTLSDCYGKCSDAKEKAYDDCVRLFLKLKGYDFKIISFNSFMFTAGFTFIDEDGCVCLMYITPSQVKKIYL